MTTPNQSPLPDSVRRAIKNALPEIIDMIEPEDRVSHIELNLNKTKAVEVLLGAIAPLWPVAGSAVQATLPEGATPETDAVQKLWRTQIRTPDEIWDFARQLERQRDEARRDAKEQAQLVSDINASQQSWIIKCAAAVARSARLESDLAAVREELERVRKDYYNVADALAPRSDSAEHLAQIARDLRTALTKREAELAEANKQWENSVSLLAASDCELVALRQQHAPASPAESEAVFKALLEEAQEVVDNAEAAYSHRVSTHGILNRLKPAVLAARAATKGGSETWKHQL